MPPIVLPPEVIERVIDYCHANSYTLRHLTLTCRQLLPRSRRYLFAYVCVEGADVDTLYMFYDTLAAQPWLRVLICSVKIVARASVAFKKPDEDTRAKPNLLEVIPTTLLTLPNLTQWSIVRDPTLILPTAKLTSFTPRVLAIYRKYGSTIRVLCLQDIEYLTGDDFWRFLSALPSLRSLCCEGITFEQLGVLRTLTQPGYRRPRRLELDNLEIPGPLGDDAIKVLLESCSHHTSLKSLALDISHAERFFPFISQLPRLHRLTLECKLGDEITVVHSIARLIKALKLFAELSIASNAFELILRMSISFPSRLNQLLAAGDAPRICQALEQQLLTIPQLRQVILRFRGLGPNREYFWMVALGNHFPKLRQCGLFQVHAEQATAIGHDNTTPRLDNLQHNAMSAIAVSQDSEWVATGSTDTTIILWCLKQRRIASQWVAHSGAVSCLAFSPNGQNLLSGGRLGCDIVIWDISLPQGAQRISALNAHHGLGSPDACAWSPARSDYESLVACAFQSGREIYVWDVYTLQRRHTFPLSEGFASGCSKDLLTFSPDGRWLTAEGRDGSCCVWETATGALHTILRDLGLIIYTAVFDPSGKRIATASGRGGNAMVQLWDVEAGVRLLSFGKGLLGPTRGLNVSFSPDGRTVLSMGSDHPTIWDASTGEEIRALHGPGCMDAMFQLCFSPDGRYVAAASFDGEVKLWRVRDGAYVATLSGHRDHCSKLALYVAFSAEAETIFYTCGDGTVYMYHLHDLVEHPPVKY